MDKACRNLYVTFTAIISTVDITNMTDLIDQYVGNREDSILYQEALEGHIRLPLYKKLLEVIQ